MPLSPLIVLILLLFLASVAIIFFIWSLFTLTTPHLIANPRQLGRKNARLEPEAKAEPDPLPSPRVKTGSSPKPFPATAKNPFYQKPLASKEQLKERLGHSQVKTIKAYVPTPNAPPVQAVVTKNYPIHSKQEALEPEELSEAPAPPQKFSVIEAGSEPKPAQLSQQLPLFADMVLPEPKLSDEDDDSDEDAFDRFIKSKNRDTGF